MQMDEHKFGALMKS